MGRLEEIAKNRRINARIAIFTLKMQRRVRRSPLHFVIPTTIGAGELLINCNPALPFRNKRGDRVDSYHRDGIQISWCYTRARVLPLFRPIFVPEALFSLSLLPGRTILPRRYSEAAAYFPPFTLRGKLHLE